MTIEDLIAILEDAGRANQGLRYHAGRPERRYNERTGECYVRRDPTELSLFGERASNFYRVIENASLLAEQLRSLVKEQIRK